ncbi:hypothetical protein DL98DRAFT_600366 [Cadophora sp. DSE1049]|nr:hypothetical protein DL98DRAFT_600366 [Cadophora sp. DSE1049]
MQYRSDGQPNMTPLQMLLVALMGIAIGSVHAGPVGLEGSDKTKLEKRAVCYMDAYSNPYTCLDNYSCCVGVYVSGCIPSGYLCCDMGDWLGWCPVGSACSISNGYPVCLESNGNTVTAATATIEPTSPTPTTSQTPGPKDTTPVSPSKGSLSKGAIIGISVSVACSILGLIIGIWIKYHFSKKAAKKGEVS